MCIRDRGNDLPWDGKVFGDLLVRGPWITSSYFKDEGGDPLRPDDKGQGWFPTGDVATIDPDGYMQITDRSKDVIKTGGEWISTIELENIAVGHPAVADGDVFQLDGADPFAAGLDHVLGAVGDLHVAIGVDGGDVAGREPALSFIVQTQGVNDKAQEITTENKRDE